MAESRSSIQSIEELKKEFPVGIRVKVPDSYPNENRLIPGKVIGFCETCEDFLLVYVKTRFFIRPFVLDTVRGRRNKYLRRAE